MRHRPMRHNPPLSEHMKHDDLSEIAAALDDRFYMMPADGIDFVLRCLEPIYARLDAEFASASRGGYAEDAVENLRAVSDAAFMARNRLHEAYERLQSQYGPRWTPPR